MTVDNGGKRCGCKGTRYCGLCLDSERVKKLAIKSYDEYKCYVFNEKDGLAYPQDNLYWHSSSEEVIKASEGLSTSTPDRSTSINVDGLLLINDFISENEESFLVEKIDKKSWVLSQSGRRKQDYGPRVNFKYQRLKYNSFNGMPDYADLILQRMHKLNASKLSDYQPFELCNLEYCDDRASWIDLHKDDMWIWGERLISLNLLNGCVMTFENETTKQILYVYMPRRSLLCIYGDARFSWNHGIFPNHIYGRRIALTMREPSKAFQPGGELYDPHGKALIERGNIRIET